MIEIGIQALLAPVILSVASLVIMMQIAFWRNSNVSWFLTCVSLLIAILAIIPFNGNSAIPSQTVTPLLISDQYSVFYSLLILFATLVTALLAKDYLQFKAGENEEFYLLLILSALGALILVSATHLASFLLGLELLGVALYALIAYPERGHLPLEAAIKYLILSGAASAILLFGFALIYAALGSLSFSGIGQQLMATQTASQGADNHLLILMGTAMAITGIGFKLSLVPFHMWTPDVYHGAPAPVSGFLATVSKGAIFAALMRLFIDAQLYNYAGLMLGLSILAIASMVMGNLLALKQDNIKRMLAYSSIAHLGYLFVALIAYSALQQTELAIEAVGFYLLAYIVTSLAAFALLTIISSSSTVAANRHSERDHIDDIQGLFWRHPLLATLLTVTMLSLAGIPLTVGFIGKFYLFIVGIKGALWLLLGALVIGSGIGIYYYLRIVFTMTMKEASVNKNFSADFTFSLIAKIVVYILIFVILILGILPQAFMQYIGGISL